MFGHGIQIVYFWVQGIVAFHSNGNGIDLLIVLKCLSLLMLFPLDHWRGRFSFPSERSPFPARDSCYQWALQKLRHKTFTLWRSECQKSLLARQPGEEMHTIRMCSIYKLVCHRRTPRPFVLDQVKNKQNPEKVLIYT